MALSRPTLLVLRALGLGDFLAGIPALRALRRSFPGHRLILAAPRVLEPLAEVSGCVDEFVDVGPLEPLPAWLSRADVAVNLHGKGPESHRVLLAAAPRRLMAFRHPEVPESAGMPEWRAGEHEVDRWCRLLAEVGIATDPTELALESEALPRVPHARGATVIHPGAASGARRWPAARFAAVARSERRAGRRILVTGSAGERGLAHDVAAAAGVPSRSVLAGETDLLGLAAVVAGAARVVSGDTGIAHLATALGTPSVVVFGPTPPSQWGPRVCPERHAALWAGERGDPHAEAPSGGLLAVEVEEVLRALERLPTPVRQLVR